MELDDHPRKRNLMRIAFTLRDGRKIATDIIKADGESKAKLKT